ncbi:hypothetical protein P4475_07535 [Halalkalibacterium halodurans]|uniref:BH3476 protein n=2 Tax=Halalkalibacterium halodurans TaxID=86665 RepID=Q9K793_HALH5|nr:hypothetical protein [Halalkalibacterium halodurans]MDY7224003.1 hypothetical protein [Halalkalibacterium halodurans]MDY7243288.1 hypothetical protein [Halalkalibacterium halodurans]MED3646666.1 hypothetical protein [Halalkalibacterium halodurans]MED4124682.1 hypothetical protein [Halalkalibacterium halodurans]MED4173482.1 hypothetical protein [Halalkalibacterium halodurans]
MYHILTFLISILEWSALLSFPVLLFGYTFRRYRLSIVAIGTLLSLLSIFVLRMVPHLHLPIVIFIQMTVLFILVRWLFRFNSLESLVVTSSGYGFYIFTQLIIVEAITAMSSYSYWDVLLSYTDVTLLIQSGTFLLVTTASYGIYRGSYQLNEFRGHIEGDLLSTKEKRVIFVSAFMMFLFICFASYVMTTSAVLNKHLFVLFIIVLLFLVLSTYYVLHSIFQAKRMMEAKKFYLDQEQQLSSIVETIQNEYSIHSNAILKLCEKESAPLIREYVEKKVAIKKLPSFSVKDESYHLFKSEDEVMYAFLINKKKLSRLLGVEFKVSATLEHVRPTSLWQIRYLSRILDEVFVALYRTGMSDLFVRLQINMTDSTLEYRISSNLELSEQDVTTLKIVDDLMYFQQNNAKVDSQIRPLECSIRFIRK